jgi:hypothetical protein
MAQPREPFITDGGRALLAHIRKSGVSIPAWCEANGLDRFLVQKLIHGTVFRVSVNLAFAVEKATRGKVKAAHFVIDEADASARSQRARSTAA